MSFFISDALAAVDTTSDGLLSFLPLIIIFGVFYFLLIRPQQKKAKAHVSMVNNLKKGDEVVSSGGLLGKIVSVGENFVSVAVTDTMTLMIQKNQISQLMPKGTIKEAK